MAAHTKAGVKWADSVSRQTAVTRAPHHPLRRLIKLHGVTHRPERPTTQRIHHLAATFALHPHALRPGAPPALLTLRGKHTRHARGKLQSKRSARARTGLEETLAHHASGLFTVSVCVMSNFSKSRVLSLQVPRN